MSEVLAEYAKNKSTTIIVLTVAAVLLALIAKISLTALGVVMVVIGLVGFMTSWLIDRGIISKEYIPGFILLATGIAITLVGLMVKGIIPVMFVTEDFMANIMFSLLVYTVIIAAVLGGVYVAVFRTGYANKLAEKLGARHEIDVVDRYRSKYVE